MVSALLPHISVARRLQGGLLEPLRVVKLWHNWILPHAGKAVSRRNVRKAGGLQGSQGRWCVNGVDRPAHVEAGRRTVAVVIPLRSLVSTGLLKNLRGVVMIFPIHFCGEPEAAGPFVRPASAWTFSSTCLWRNCRITYSSAQVCHFVTM